MTIVNIREIVETVLKQDFIKSRRKFSAHEVTLQIRKLIQDGTYTIDGISDHVLVDGKKVQRIRHEDVRDFVVEFMNRCSEYTSVMATAGSHTFKQYVPKSKKVAPTKKDEEKEKVTGDVLLI